jgi:hypothetical protein
VRPRCTGVAQLPFARSQSCHRVSAQGRFVEIRVAVIREQRLAAGARQFVLPLLVLFHFHRLFRRSDRLDRLIVCIDEGDLSRRVPSVPEFGLKLCVVSAIAGVKAGDSPIAGVHDGDKLRDVRNCTICTRAGQSRNEIGTDQVTRGVSSRCTPLL